MVTLTVSNLSFFQWLGEDMLQTNGRFHVSRRYTSENIFKGSISCESNVWKTYN